MWMNSYIFKTKYLLLDAHRDTNRGYIGFLMIEILLPEMQIHEAMESDPVCHVDVLYNSIR